MLRACVEVNDGQTALQVLGRQAAEPKQLQSAPPADALTVGQGGQREVSGGPPDRRCWSLAAEALGRAGMAEEVRLVVQSRSAATLIRVLFARLVAAESFFFVFLAAALLSVGPRGCRLLEVFPP